MRKPDFVLNPRAFWDVRLYQQGSLWWLQLYSMAAPAAHEFFLKWLISEGVLRHKPERRTRFSVKMSSGLLLPGWDVLLVVSVVVARLWEALMWEGMKQRKTGRCRWWVGVMQPQHEPKLDVSFRRISPYAAGIHMSSLVIHLLAG